MSTLRGTLHYLEGNFYWQN